MVGRDTATDRRVAGGLSVAVSRAASLLRRVEFRLAGKLVPKARQVALVGSFNRWRDDASSMQRGADGNWVIVLDLPPGVHAYLFYADGDWWNDPEDDGRLLSEWGNEYSLKVGR